ncbi:MAG: hypothetical protein ACK5MN_03635 [Lachnospiraceae bacterium]
MEFQNQNKRNRHIILVLVTALLLGLVTAGFLLNVYAADDGGYAFTDMAPENAVDPVWGVNYYRYKDNGDCVVTSYNELTGAVSAANGTYNANKPYIIPIANNITMTGSITISSSKNIVFRKVTGSETMPGDGNYYTNPNTGYAGRTYNYIIQKWWDFTNDYPAKNASGISPDMYDGEADFFLNVSGNFSHFKFTGSSEVKLTTENVTLFGRNSNSVVYSKTGTYAQGGGIDLANSKETTLAVNISGVYGVAFNINNTALVVNWRGGVFAHNHGGDFAGFTLRNMKTLNISGYSIFENNYSNGEGGAIYTYWNINQNTLVNIIDDVIFRSNTGGDGGALHIMGKNQTVNIRNNVYFYGNSAVGMTMAVGIYPGNGGAILLTGDIGFQTLNIYDNVTFENNEAVRGGGAIAVGTNKKIFPETALNLYGGKFLGNRSTGIARALQSGSTAADRYAIGGGGAIYAYIPTMVKIPVTSIVYFERNMAPFAAFMDNSELQNGTTGNAFYNGDTYISHIQNPNVHTSLINTHGQTGEDYYNLYNNYDIGAANNQPHKLYAIIKMILVPEDGSGGQVLGGDANQLYDMVGDGQLMAEVYHPLEYTAQPLAGYLFSGWEITSDVVPLASEWQALLGNNQFTLSGNKITITPTGHETLSFNVQPWYMTVTAKFSPAPAAKLEVTNTPGFNVVLGEFDTSYTNPDTQFFDVLNVGDILANVTDVQLVGDNADKFQLFGTTGDILPGATDTTTWSIQPVELDPMDDTNFGTYSVTVRFTYTDAYGLIKTLDKMVIFNFYRAPHLLIESTHDFGVHVAGARPDWQTVRLADYGVDATLLGAVLTTDSAGTILDERGIFSVGDDAHSGDPMLPGWGGNNVACTGVTMVDGDVSEHWRVRVNQAAGVAPGSYTAYLWIYENDSDPLNTRRVGTPVTVTIVSPASVAIDAPRLGASYDAVTNTLLYAGTYYEGYAIPPNMVEVRLTNSGQTVAQIVGVDFLPNPAQPAPDGSSAFVLSNRGLGNYIAAYNTTDGDGRNTTYAVSPKAALLGGPNGMGDRSYESMIQVSFADGTDDYDTASGSWVAHTAALTVNTAFSVKGAPLWEFAISPTGSYTFLTRTEGYAQQDVLDETVINIGNMDTGAMVAEVIGAYTVDETVIDSTNDNGTPDDPEDDTVVSHVESVTRYGATRSYVNENGENITEEYYVDDTAESVWGFWPTSDTSGAAADSLGLPNIPYTSSLNVDSGQFYISHKMGLQAYHALDGAGEPYAAPVTYTALVRVRFNLEGVVDDIANGFNELTQKQEEYQMLQVTFTVTPKAPTPAISIDWEQETLIGFSPNSVYYFKTQSVSQGGMFLNVRFTAPIDFALPLQSYMVRITDTGDPNYNNGNEFYMYYGVPDGDGGETAVPDPPGERVEASYVVDGVTTTRPVLFTIQMSSTDNSVGSGWDPFSADVLNADIISHQNTFTIQRLASNDPDEDKISDPQTLTVPARPAAPAEAITVSEGASGYQLGGFDPAKQYQYRVRPSSWRYGTQSWFDDWITIAPGTEAIALTAAQYGEYEVRYSYNGGTGPYFASVPLVSAMSPAYVVTIPELIDFGEVTYAGSGTADSSEFTVTAWLGGFTAADQLAVTVEDAAYLQMLNSIDSDAQYALPFVLYADSTVVTDDFAVFTGTGSMNDTLSQDGIGQLNRSDVQYAGSYAGNVTFVIEKRVIVP